MISKKLKLFSITTVFFASFLFFSNAHAFTCGERNIIGNSPPYWGNDPNQNVIVSQNSQVRLSIKGEDGCAGQIAQFQIKEGSSVIVTIDLPLSLGGPVSGQTGAFILYGDLNANIQPGTYRAKLIGIGSQILSSADSSNTVTVESQVQPCSLSRLSTDPQGGVRGGQQIQLIVEAQGVCQGWGVTVNVSGTPPVCSFNGSEQKFSSGSNRLVWNWTPSNPGGPQAVCTFIASLGNQTLESSPFTIQRVGGGVPLPPAPGQPVSVSFKIPNPIQATSLIDLAKAIGKFLFDIAIPIAVIVIIYAGILFLTSGGDKGKITKARDALWYAVIGLAIILIGQGFFVLIKSILDLGGPSP